MKLKLDQQGHAVLSDGRPVYIHDDGTEIPFDATSNAATLARLARESNDTRERLAQSGDEKYAAAVKERDELRHALHAEKIGGSFARSKFIAEKLAVPIDMLQATFGSAFKVEDNGIVGYDRFGNRLLSRKRPGENAPFDEALSLLVEQYPHRDQILKGSGASGGGAQGAGGAAAAARVINRAAFEALPPARQMAHIKAGGTLSD